MAARVLNIVDLASVPYREVVRKCLETGFAELIRAGVLQIDFQGASKSSMYQLTFPKTFSWGPVSRDRNWYRPPFTGVTGTVQLEAIRRTNYCRDVRRAATCEPVDRDQSAELGKSIGNTAVHEAGHILGLMNGGLDGSAHNGDPGNFMFVIPLHSDYRAFFTDSVRTRKLAIRRGDTLSAIADRIGFRAPWANWRTLYDFKGKDGRRNRDILRSGNPDLIYPGEEIWIPDIDTRLAYFRLLEHRDRRFTAEQIATMRAFLEAGKTVFDRGE